MKRCLILLLTALMLFSMAHAEEVSDMYIDASLGKLYGVLNLPEGEGPFPLIILSHGFGGSHAGSLGYAARFAENGFATFCLDFCGGGLGSKSDGTMREMTVLTEAEDLTAVIRHFETDARFSGISLWGQSQGGFVSSYVAAQMPDTIRCLVIEFPAYVLQDDAKARAQADGSFTETSNVMGMTIGRRYNEDAVSFDIYEVIGAYAGPALILHGDRDAIVPLRYSERAVFHTRRYRTLWMPYAA